MRIAFWICALFVTYTYLGYPGWLCLRARWRPLRFCPAPNVASVSVVMAVHNEQELLPRKLRNLIELNYPGDRWEIIVVSDGSTDATDEILEAHASKRVRVIVSPHRGKASALNRGIEAASGEIVVFTDVRQLIEADGVLHLVSNFADPSVGCASGELVLGTALPASSGVGLGIYWNLEKKIRQWEGAAGSVVGATGAFYAVRRDLLVPLPAGTLLDDVYLPLHVVRQGRRVIFDPRARAYDRVATPSEEFRRKVRTLTGSYQLLRLAPWLLSAANPVRFEFVCHKLLRLLVPFALFGLLVSSLLARGAGYQLVFGLQIAFYATALLALFRFQAGGGSRLPGVALAFLLLNTAAAVAFLYFISGKKAVWTR